MAVGLNLVDTAISEFSLRVAGNDAEVWYLIEIKDENGDIVRYDREDTVFTALPLQIRAAFNNALRLLSKQVNNDKVNENWSTWTDI